MVEIKLYARFDISCLELLGSGTQGKVYKIDANTCIKIYKHKHSCKDEVRSLVIAQNDPHFPILYSYGTDYIVRELIAGIELDKYLSSNKLTNKISGKLLELYDAMQKVGYHRLDSAIFHIFITPAGQLKLIDTAKAMKKHTVYPYLILEGLCDLGLKEEFLSYVKFKRPDLYQKWLK